MSQKWENFLLQNIQKKRRKRKGGLENTGELSLSEINAVLVEENRKLQFEVTRLKRALVERPSFDDITSRKLNLCKTELEEERKKCSGKR